MKEIANETVTDVKEPGYEAPELREIGQVNQVFLHYPVWAQPEFGTVQAFVD